MHIHTERHTEKGKLNLRNCQENNTDETRRYLKYHMQFCFPHLKTDLLEKSRKESSEDNGRYVWFLDEQLRRSQESIE